MPATSEADMTAAAAQGAAVGAAQGAAATSTVQGTKTTVDVNAEEFMRTVLANAAGLNVLNGKQILDNTIDAAQHSVQAAQGHLENIQTVQLQLLRDMVGHSKDMDQMHKDQAKLGSDRMWNLNETDNMATIVTSILGNLGVKGDAGAAAILEALGRILREQNKPA